MAHTYRYKLIGNSEKTEANIKTALTNYNSTLNINLLDMKATLLFEILVQRFLLTMK